MAPGATGDVTASKDGDGGFGVGIRGSTGEKMSEKSLLG